MSKTALLTGATGMAGGQVLNALLECPAVERIVSVGRRKTGVTNGKLHEIVHGNFLDLSGLKSDLAGVDVCFHCLATYQSQVSKQAYFQITCDYQKALTDTLAEAGPQATFVLFGAQGADPSETGLTFARAKGRAENLLHATDFPKKYMFRPGYIHPTGARKPRDATYRLLLPVAAVLFKLFPRIGISDRDLARAMVMVGVEAAAPSSTFSNPMIREIVAGRSPKRDP